MEFQDHNTNSTEDKSRFKPHLMEIEDNPISPLGRKILWTILIFMVITVIWLFVGKTDVVVSARSEAIPVGNVKTVQSLTGGSVKKIFVKEGDPITQGAPLIEIDPTVEETNIEAKERTLVILELETQKLKSLIHDTPFSVNSDIDPNIASIIEGMHKSEKEAINEEIEGIGKQINQINEEIRSIEIDKNRAYGLYKMGLAEERRLRSVLDIIAKDEYYRAQKENLSLKNEINRKSHEVNRLRQQLLEFENQKSLVRKNFQSRLYEKLTQKEKELLALRSEIDTINFKKQKQVITSPVDGIVGQLAITTVGAVVTPAEKLMTIIPNDVPIRFKAIVENKDIGFIHKGMDVAVKIDTFNYQRYGLIDGKVSQIAANAIMDERLGLIYEVFVVPQQNHLVVEGEKRYLVPGMSATSELKVGERRIIEFFIYPLIKYMDEGVSVR